MGVFLHLTEGVLPHFTADVSIRVTVGFFGPLEHSARLDPVAPPHNGRFALPHCGYSPTSQWAFCLTCTAVVLSRVTLEGLFPTKQWGVYIHLTVGILPCFTVGVLPHFTVSVLLHVVMGFLPHFTSFRSV